MVATRLNPKGTSVRGALQNFKQSPEHVDNYRKIRLRNIEILRGYLQGETLEHLADKYGVSYHVAQKAASEMVRLLWFRSKDRKGLVAFPDRMKGVQQASAYWLDQLQENEEALRLLDFERHH